MNSRVSKPSSQHRLDESIDGQLAKALEQYLAARDAGTAPDRELFLHQHPEISELLELALDGFDCITKLAPQLNSGLDLSPSAGGNGNQSQQLGDFQIIREVGRGGMGVVYEARQMSLGRTVAVKVLPFTGLLSANQLQRFKNEAQAAASLHHPHIVNSFFVGQERGVHFYAMQFIDGMSLSNVIESIYSTTDDRESKKSTDNTSPVASLSTQRNSDRREFYRSTARLGIQICEALSYAHAIGIVHRDIKPSNLLVDNDGHVWVTDFGLASIQTNETMTVSGDLIGTFRYMSPEQANSEHDLIDSRTDIYSLGVTLYELLLGRPAIQGDDRVRLLRNLDSDVNEPMAIDARIPPDLNNIILKATAKLQADRYSSAAEFQADLERFVEGRPVVARRIGRFGRFVRWTRRHPLQALLVSLVALLSLVLSIGGPLTALTLHEQVQELAAKNYALSMSAAYQAWQKSRLLEVKKHLESASANETITPGFEFHHLAARLSHALDVPTGSHNGKPVPRVIFTPDRSRLVSCCDDGYIRFWDPEDLTLLDKFKAHDAEIMWIEYSPDGKLLASAGIGATVKLWHSDSLSLKKALKHADDVYHASFTPDGRFFATIVATKRGLRFWDLKSDGETSRHVPLAPEMQRFGSRILFSPDGQFMVSIGKHFPTRVWRYTSSNNIEQVAFQLCHVLPAMSTAAAFSDRGDQLVTCGKELQIWDTTMWKLKEAFPLDAPCDAVTFFQSDSMLASAGQALKIWDLSTNGSAVKIPSHFERVRSLVVTPDSKHLVASFREGVIRKFSIDTLPHRRPEVRFARIAMTVCNTGHAHSDTDPLHHLAVATAPSHGQQVPPSFDIVDVQTGHRVPVSSNPGSYESLATDPKNPEIVAAGGFRFDGQIRPVVDLWNVKSKAIVWSPELETRGYVTAVAISHSGDLLAVAGRETATLQGLFLDCWSISRRKRLFRVTDLMVNTVSFSRDDRFLIASGGDWNHGHCYLVDAAQGTRIATLPVHNSQVIDACFSDNGHTFLAVDVNGGFNAFSWPDRSLLFDGTRFRHGRRAAVAISPANKTAVVASERELEFWHLSSGQKLGSLQVDEPICDVVFMPGGQQCAALDETGCLWVWHRDGRTDMIPPVRDNQTGSQAEDRLDDSEK